MKTAPAQNVGTEAGYDQTRVSAPWSTPSQTDSEFQVLSQRGGDKIQNRL